MKRIWTIFIIAVMMVISSQTSHGLIVKYSIDELAQRATQIVIGEVTSMKTRWNKEQEPIYTEITLNVKETLKGNPGIKVITIEQIGGTNGDITLTVPDTAKFKTGTTVLLFIDQSEDYTDLAGWYQGKFSIRGNFAIQEKTGYKISLDKLKSIINQYK